MLYRFRKWQEQLAEQEARGVSLWTSKFDQNVRTRIMYALRDSLANWGNPAAIADVARNQMLVESGKWYLYDVNLGHAEDFFKYLMKCDDAEMPTVVEALVQAYYSIGIVATRATEFQDCISQILREHRISFDLVNRRMVEFSSREMHAAVIGPVSTLLAESARWDKVEKAYQDALREISNGEPGDAITDAGTALQELLTELGCDGNALGPLIVSARKKGILASHDGQLVDGVVKILSWVSADRSNLGDAHKATDAELADAWFTVHVVGAIILRLVAGGRREKNC